ncbi:uncharacterized protein EI90DRAFT_3134196 [Cantharellus anzutake]|uniref:uncharacterized protein n=1 Tax=Cantharellus anzutake TaxID=1750568 RepID=UPI001903C923|nr:uncharacterized protein EI90DRAFT_3134196 [Cantharellus anzutake]KAF8316941.1 hypothetical protein EI90DRAFT_3134196 [Cantharellus anzutake]
MQLRPPPADHPMVVVIDGLDECEKDAFETFANTLRKEVPQLPRSVKFFVTSRHFDLVQRYLSPSVASLLTSWMKDCASFVRSQLNELETHPTLVYDVDEELLAQQITARSNGPFGWISTVFIFLKTKGKSPMTTLRKLVDMSSDPGRIPAERMMDRLYASILEKCDWEDDDLVHDYPIVMGALLAASRPLSVTAWDIILSTLLFKLPSLNLAHSFWELKNLTRRFAFCISHSATSSWIVLSHDHPLFSNM